MAATSRAAPVTTRHWWLVSRPLPGKRAAWWCKVTRTTASNSGASSPGLDGQERERRFTAWLQSPAGSRLLAAERPSVDESVRRFHGDAMLWIGATPALLDITSRCMVRECFYLAPHNRALSAIASNRGQLGDAVNVVVADSARLPFPPASFDGVVLHHAMEAAVNRRGVLREAARVLRPGGRLLVLSFNPFSPWLLSKARPVFRDLKPVSVPRLYDWLALLGLEREAETIYLYCRSVLPFPLDGGRRRNTPEAAHEAPIGQDGWLRGLRSILGMVYLITATKVGYGFIAQHRLLDAARAELTAAPLPNPAARQAI